MPPYHHKTFDKRPPSPAVSVIIPVYNSEKYLKNSVESVLGQTFSGFECILVEDCSTDNSAALCDKYAKKDGRVRVIHNRENQGSSVSRKTGLDAASGEYIQFIDSDDWVEKTMLEKLLAFAVTSGSDLVWADFYEAEDEYRKQIIDSADKTAILKRIFDYEKCAAAVLWAKFIRKDILTGVEFPAAMQWEDLVITAQLVFNSKKTLHVDGAFYHHRNNPDSVSVNKARKAAGLGEIISNLDLTIRYCEKFLGDDFYKLEPELSACVNRFKFESMFVDELRKSGVLFSLYPQSNKTIFSSAWKKSIFRKLALFASVKKTPGIYLFFDLLRPILRAVHKNMPY